jgi:hypothetical protein
LQHSQKKSEGNGMLRVHAMKPVRHTMRTLRRIYAIRAAANPPLVEKTQARRLASAGPIGWNPCHGTTGIALAAAGTEKCRR